jgi:Domain of unknown function (DUF4259)
MGAWGSGPFENDDAADWRYQLVDGGGPEVVADALRAVHGTNPPQGPADSSAVGAAAVVAAGLGIADVELPDDVSEWLSGIEPAAWPPLAQEAVAALDRVLLESELRDLWDEVGDGSWTAETRALRNSIDAARGA